MQIRDKLYIDGRWTAASGKKTLDVISASTEEVMGRIPEGDEIGRASCRERV